MYIVVNRNTRRKPVPCRFAHKLESTAASDYLELYLKFHILPRRRHTHTVSCIKNIQLMLYGEIIAVFLENRTEHINTLCGHNLEFLNVKTGSTHGKH